jgi:polysaccharide biosynthesis/export protein
LLIRKLLPILALAVLTSLSGCASRGGPIPYDVPSFVAPDSDRPPLGSEGIIGRLDTLSVQVYQLPELNRDLQVDSDGNISMPLVGTVKAEGLNSAELAQEITARLAARYVRSPSVQVSIKETVAKMVTVDGSVKKPGMFPIRGEITLLRAITLASGPDDNANIHRVVVFRQINGQRNAAAFDLAVIRSGQAQDPVIYGNDVIVIDGSGLASAYRELLQAIPLLYLFNRF